MSRGGKREGAGAKPKDPRVVKIPVGYKLSRWLVEWMREQKTPAARILEDAVIKQHKLTPPTNKPTERRRTARK